MTNGKESSCACESVHHEWLQQLFAYYRRISPSLLLENKGSVARDHLSNERTYLAWLRTSLSIITVGVGESSSRPFILY
ncbi:hypothetical protein BC938DRAFT_477459 [Jimgerdemannia flammicorona]|uniref:DUF202 domain-containing protein n=1 Tax=Jimgerdemannia flammicorona TaxID=994334 RepID=A0A433QPB7_9FUNG|nr:hypothetical protein BC938DRAFT_477459 [Jimgerdemannia flammicorona]